jgi:hypothetical protein
LCHDTLLFWFLVYKGGCGGPKVVLLFSLACMGEPLGEKKIKSQLFVLV